MSIIDIIIYLLVIVGIVGGGWILISLSIMAYGWIESRILKGRIPEKIKKEVEDERQKRETRKSAARLRFEQDSSGAATGDNGLQDTTDSTESEIDESIYDSGDESDEGGHEQDNSLIESDNRQPELTRRRARGRIKRIE